MTGTDQRPKFQVDGSLEKWQVTSTEWLQDNNDRLEEEQGRRLDGVCSGNVVLNGNGKVLLLQRAAHDSSPGRWEIPGGAVDDDDETILHGAARELYEEAGLIATRFLAVVVGSHGVLDIFPNRTGVRWFGRVVFAAEVENSNQVKLDPNEHQHYIWATEQEVQDEAVGSRPIPITHPAMKSVILRAFEAAAR